MRALVTGGAGFIGSTVVDALLARGDEVVVIDDLSTGRESNLESALRKGADLVRADIRDADRIAQVVADAAPEAIFHLAAQIDVRKSVTDPGWDARINVEGTANVLEAARRANVGRIVNTSTGGAIYGDVDVIPSPESTPPAPMAGYGTSKFCAEQYCHLYARLHGLSTVTLRYGNVYGPRQDPKGEAGVVAIFLSRLKSGEQPRIFGDGSQGRDYVYVGDVVRATLAAAERDGGVFNVGTGRETSVVELYELCRRVAGKEDVEAVFAPPRPGELQRSVLDISHAVDELGWRPEHSLEDGLRETWEWLRR
jgi:UDP-glucose 4-epimerase